MLIVKSSLRGFSILQILDLNHLVPPLIMSQSAFVHLVIITPILGIATELFCRPEYLRSRCVALRDPN
jgi:hypothetical protein